MKLELKNVSYKYNNSDTSAITDINISVNQGEFVGIIGETGSGKSTLIHMFNGLFRPDEGKVLADGCDIHGNGFDLRLHRCKVGMVFQYPEKQLFESSVLRDVAFGPTNKELGKTAAEEAAKRALSIVGIDEKDWQRNPFELSGGQKRRVAIAGVLAMEPEILILDEPTAGLDASASEKLLTLLKELNEKNNMTIVMISHSLVETAKFTKRLVVMKKSRIVCDDKTENVFLNHERLNELGIKDLPINDLLNNLRREGMNIENKLFDAKSAAEAIAQALRTN